MAKHQITIEISDEAYDMILDFFRRFRPHHGKLSVVIDKLLEVDGQPVEGRTDCGGSSHD